MMKQLNKSKLFVLATLFLPLMNFAQQAQGSQQSYFSNPLFNTLLILIIVLMLVIVVLGQSLKNLSEGDFLSNKLIEKKKEDSAGAGKITSLILLLFFGSELQAANGSQNDWLVGGIDMSTFYFMLAVIALELIIIVSLYYTFMNLLRTDKKAVETATAKVKTKTILEKINASVDIEDEKDILMDHDYDGIKELDNDLPPWWKYGFYITIIIGVIYMINFHVAGTGDLQDVEYTKSVAKAKLEVEEYMRTAASNVDETTIKQLTGADVEEGQKLFVLNCATCHGKEGQGAVGPNLVDKYWIHGGSLVDIFKSVKYGWVDKGMKSWKEDLSPMQIAQISSFIRTIVGTNPAGAKAPQGDVYQDETVPTTDSTIVVSDSLVVIKDTLK
jgi:cytochrome c oxidase cbb3-type subunit 3